MNFGSKTSLGIDICEGRINVALLRQFGGEIELVKAASADVPKGAMANGNITKPASLAGAIRQLLAQNQIRRQPAALSLVAKPILTQIIDLPGDIPENLGQFISTEIRHSPVLAGKDPYYGSCSLSSAGPDSPGRVFVAATDNEKISTLLKTMTLAGIDPRSIELDVAASARALYANRISDRYDRNLLFGLIHGSVMTMCVFRKGEFDFIRYIDMGADADDPGKCAVRCEDEFSAVIQFYDIEVESGANIRWEFVVALDTTVMEAQDLEFSLQKKFGVEAHVCSSSTIYTDTALKKNASAEQASLTAVGLAMKRFEVPASQIKIDLIPPEVQERKVTKKLILVTANIAAIILLFMLVTAGIVRIRLNLVQPSSPQSQYNNPAESMELLLTRKKLIDTKVAELSTKRAKIDEIFEDDTFSNWAGILDDIRYRTPATLCITRLSCPKGSTLEIDGQSLSYREAHLFAELLGQSEFIKSATITGTNRDRRAEGLIAYSINCELVNNRGLPADVDG